jgi:hypothetical protein
MKKTVMVLGGGTFSPVRAHLALCAPAFGKTARRLTSLCRDRFKEMDVILRLTQMAGGRDSLATNGDVDKLVTKIINDNTVKVVFFNIALCDYVGTVGEIESGKHAARLSTTEQPNPVMQLEAAPKIIRAIRQHRKDIFLVGFKTTCGATQAEQFRQGLNLLKQASCNLVLANDIETHSNLIITPEEGVYGQGLSRDECLGALVQMAYWRSHLSFTKSTVVDGQPVSWDAAEIPATLRTVVNHCIQRGAYKRFRGVTTGHFAFKVGPQEFLTSIRKTDFNKIGQVGMVRVRTDGPDNVIAYGAKPSVGGQSQRIVVNTFPDADCIVHFHCPLRHSGPAAVMNLIPTRSQFEYECGSHECGQNTADGLKEIWPGIKVVMLDRHGPNIVFHHSIDAAEVIRFIETYFDLDKTTSGFEQVYLPLAANS